MANRTEKASVAHPRASEAPERRRPGRKAGMQPPLTPMVDVTFQLLLFFLLTCEFRPPEGLIPSSLPDIGPGLPTIVPPPADPIRIRLHATADRASAVYQVDNARRAIHSPAELYAHLRGLFEVGGTAVPIVIEARPNVPWEFVVEAFNQAVRAEFQQVALAENL